VGGGVVAQDSEARARHRLQCVTLAAVFADEVVLPEPEEDEVVVGEEAEEVSRFSTVLLGDTPKPPGFGFSRRGPFLEFGGEGHRLGPHGRPVVHRRPHVLEDTEQVGAQQVEPLAGRLPVDLDMDERHIVDDRVDHEVQPAALPDERHRDRVEEEGHVVDDDLDHRVGRRPAVVVEGRGVDADPRCARRAVLAQMEVGERGAGQVDGVTADNVLGRNPLPVAPDEALGGCCSLCTVDPGSHVGRRPFQQAAAGFLERHRHMGTLVLVNGAGVSRPAADSPAQQGRTVQRADSVPVAGRLEHAGV